MTGKVTFKQLFKHPIFMTGLIFLFLLLMGSFVHEVFFHGNVPETKYLYEDGRMVAKAPFSPSEIPPLGTGSNGNHMLEMLLKGAKYTIGIALIVAAARVVIGSIIGLLFGKFLSRFNQYISGFVNAFYYVPMALICYVILNNVIMFSPFDEDPYTFVQNAIFELIILTVIAVPTTSLLLANQIDHVYKNEFITAAEILGGRRWHVMRKHVLPHMWPRLILQFSQEVVQVLILLIHLGFFHLLFGGTLWIAGDQGISSIYISISSEWSGLIGNAFQWMDTFPWIFFGPTVAFALLILAFNFMIRGMEDVFFGFNPLKKGNQKQQETQKPVPENPSFEFVYKADKKVESF